MSRHNKKMSPFIGILGLIALSVLSVQSANGQTVGKSTVEVKPGVSATAAAPVSQTGPAPLFTAYRKVTIGLTSDEIKEILGKPKVEDKDGFFYEISDDEFVQIRLDSEGKIRVISVTYTSENKAAPTYSQVLGGEESAANANGSVYNLVRYPSAGYWVAYSRSGGDGPTITVTMQKL